MTLLSGGATFNDDLVSYLLVSLNAEKFCRSVDIWLWAALVVRLWEWS